MDSERFSSIYAVIVAAGKGTRMGLDVPKQLLPYGGGTVLETSVRAFAERSDVDRVIVVSPSDGSLDEVYGEIAARVEKEAAAGAVSKENELSAGCRIRIVRGGAERGDSVRAGLKAAAADVEERGLSSDEILVMIHDAARPGVDDEIISSCIEAMKSCDAVTAAVPSTDSVRKVLDSALKESSSYPIITSAYVERRLVYMVQTPQCFRLSDILDAYAAADADGFTCTDDASVAEHAGMRVAIVKGSRANSKITTREDIHMAVRTGTGYDVHRLVPERPLILCGTPIPSKLGLDGHSDADVAAHALMDALLGAAGLGDIGRHFPDTDDRYKGADSMKLLAEVRRMLGDAVINNVDVTIIAQAPKLAPYMEEMRHNLATVLGIPESAVNVKATTEEGLGFTGRGEGIASIAAAAIEGSF